MSKKILFVATVQSHICQFHLPIMEMLKEEGFEVHVAARDNLAEKNGLQMKYSDKVYNIPFERSPFNKSNILAYKILSGILKKENYDMIHCNTPVGSIVTRLAAIKFRKNSLRVIYTAHGFHFYKGAPIKNWILYYPIEKIMAYLTDDLITITKEDYDLAIRKKFKCNVHHIHGVGVNSNKFKQISEEDKSKLRYKKGYNDEFIILCTGELNTNKNQVTLVKSMVEIVKCYPDTKLLLAGNGPSHDELEVLIKSLGLEKNIELLGYKTDLEDYVNLCDLVVSASFREGMPLNIMEGMICGKPIIASDNRGHRELIHNKENGVLVEASNIKGFCQEICKLIKDIKIRGNYCNKSLIYIKPYDIKNVKNRMSNLYSK